MDGRTDGQQIWNFFREEKGERAVCMIMSDSGASVVMCGVPLKCTALRLMILRPEKQNKWSISVSVDKVLGSR